jgi:hypothetical protein
MRCSGSAFLKEKAMFDYDKRSFSKKNKPLLITLHSSLFILIAVQLSGCGYKPSAHVVRNLFADSVYVEVKVDRVEPENAPYLKDEMNRMVYTRFKGHIVPKDQAESQIIVSYNGSRFIPVTYTDGYVTRYSVRVRVHFDMVTKKGKLSKTITTIHDADIDQSALSSSALRIEAIRKGMEKAMDEFLAYASAKGVLSAKD